MPSRGVRAHIKEVGHAWHSAFLQRWAYRSSPCSIQGSTPCESDNTCCIQPEHDKMLSHLQGAPRFADTCLGDLKPEGYVRWVERLWKTTEGLKPECVEREGGDIPEETPELCPESQEMLS